MRVPVVDEGRAAERPRREGGGREGGGEREQRRLDAVAQSQSQSATPRTAAATPARDAARSTATVAA